MRIPIRLPARLDNLMCGRFVILRQLEEIARLFEAGILRASLSGPNFNVAPTTLIPAIVEREGRQLVEFRWGFTPVWAKADGSSPQPINARAETVATSGMFRNAFRRRRCVIPADGFYEWTGSRGARQPHYIHRTDGDMLAFAGIWEEHTPEQSEPVQTCAIITTDANSDVADLHHRMPAIIDREDIDFWLDSDVEDTEAVHELLRPAEKDVLVHHAVSPDVNNVRNNSPDLIQPFEQERLF